MAAHCRGKGGGNDSWTCPLWNVCTTYICMNECTHARMHAYYNYNNRQSLALTVCTYLALLRNSWANTFPSLSACTSFSLLSAPLTTRSPDTSSWWGRCHCNKPERVKDQYTYMHALITNWLSVFIDMTILYPILIISYLLDFAALQHSTYRDHFNESVSTEHETRGQSFPLSHFLLLSCIQKTCGPVHIH